MQNPECLELWELISEAEKMLNLYQYKKGLDLIHQANQGCKDFIAMDKKKAKEKFEIKSFIQLHWKTIALEILGLLIAIMLLTYYFKRRSYAKPL